EVFVPIREQYDPLLRVLRKRGQRQAERAGQVGVVARDHRGDVCDLQLWGRHELDVGIAAENEDASRVVRAHTPGRLVEVAHGRFLLLGGDTVRAVQEKQHAQLLAWA